MSGVIVVGSQWGDEGKGKIVDFFAEHADAVVRYQGGNNAGHTIWHGDTKFELSALPSGIVTKGQLAILGNGVVINPEALLAEIKKVESQGVTVENLIISNRAHVIMPYHIALDKASETASNNRIGTTKKGIGPAYTDKISRVGIRVADLIDPEIFGKLLKEYLPFKNAQLTKLYGEEALDYNEIYDKYVEYGSQLAPYVTDTSYLLGQQMKENKRVVFEGAQGVMLDVDHGTYPFVTSSNPTAGGVMNGAGVGPKQIQDVVGVIKAYTSRVGSGPFPTELFNDTADHIREIGHEYGVVTKRPRRIGWLDAVALRHTVQVSGLTKLAINSLDVLSGLKEVKIATSYTYKGEKIHHFPASDTWFQGLDVNFETLPGWDEDITDVTKFDELPINAQNYLKRISELLEVDLLSFAVGPKPEQTHLLRPVWE
ncbi:adenylosuccinate synthase [Leuconostoc mesenteroides]|uniref:Adenylosuccinate synthetase n=1 Tax=Leuconostoc mesenteroides subsp. cremoris ATCC 19254 TaxID=586220 RepID=C2KJT2_LEUMC|nr:adenylosuccinate synthase [Leuconostoc mesenteroides]EEJ42435.1 adenylosuccinate synthase [Leuconostoc mesenteroides subsp. cremoris ATCC 19254]MDG9749453.1 adenylosuccinate synthase [Leuconostoc mesenteroides]ORI48565.1 adenylosuccinate synthase [Leuconostoc mesenteroides subsp. cremoris]ORI49127.1 adenylosuccinate synthase [Leuconostoc mesenteroides subsp. cremoris]ORI51348.1 adenylosuccinate synthase [Leuconostoc mesenteroides subsp. cremoris]